MKKETIIFALEQIARHDELYGKITNTFGSEHLEPYSPDRVGIYKHFFGIDVFKSDNAAAQKYDELFYDILSSNLDYCGKAEMLYCGLTELKNSDPNQQQYIKEETPEVLEESFTG